MTTPHRPTSTDRRVLFLGGAALGAAYVLGPTSPTGAGALLLVGTAYLASAAGTAASVLAATSIALAEVATGRLGVLDGALGLLFAMVVASAVGEACGRRAALDRAAATDPLTGLLNRRGLAELAASRLVPGERASIAVLDLDGLKGLNDRRGHQHGDRAIVLLADALSSARVGDAGARLGGDELALLLPGASFTDASGVLERVRARFVASAQAEGLSVDVSIGLAEVDGSLDVALAAADAAMYDEKRRHKDRGAGPSGALPVARAPSPIRRARRFVRAGSLLSLAAVAALAVAPGRVAAQTPERASLLASPRAPSPSPVRLELLGGATVPVDVGFRARLVLLDRVVFGLSLGVGTYGDVARSIAEIAGVSDAGAQIAHDLTSGLLAGELSIGVRPVEGSGLELSLGYAVLQRSFALSSMTLAGAFGLQTAAADVETAYLLHAIHGEIGWTIVLLDHFVLRPAIGWLHVLAADVSLVARGRHHVAGRARRHRRERSLGPHHVRHDADALALGRLPVLTDTDAHTRASRRTAAERRVLERAADVPRCERSHRWKSSDLGTFVARFSWSRSAAASSWSRSA